MKKILAILKTNVIGVIFLLFAAIVFFTNIPSLNNCDSYLIGTGLYFYSSLLQANAAIISIVAIFFIFRVQSLHLATEGYYNALIASCENNLEKKLYHIFRSHSLKEKIEDVEKGNFNESFHKDIMLSCIDNIKVVNKTKGSIIFPMIILSIAIIINISGLLLTNFLHSLGSIIEIKFFSIVFLFQIYCLATLIKGVYKSINFNAI